MGRNFNVVWNPTDKKYEGARHPKYSICANDNSWYCDNYYIVTPADAIRTIIADTHSNARTKKLQALKIVKYFNSVIRRIEGKQANLICMYSRTAKGKVCRPLDLLADELEQQIYKNGKLQMDCIEIHRRKVLSHRFEWYTDFLIGKEVGELLDLVYEHNLVPEFTPKNNHLKAQFVMRGGKLTVEKKPAVTNKDASKVSQDPDGRGIKEFMPASHAWGGTKHKPAEYVYAETGYYDLENGHTAEHEQALRMAAKSKHVKKVYPQPIEEPVLADGYIDIYCKNRIDNIGEKPNMQKQMQKYLETAK